MNDLDLPNKKISVGLDIGSSKVCGIVLTDGDREGTYSVVAMATKTNTGTIRGEISNVESTKNAIGSVIAELEENLEGIKINEVVVGISGKNIETTTESFNIVISSPDQIVTKEDINKINTSIKRSKISNEKTIIHIIPYQYYKDSNAKDLIANPIGHYANKLQANVHILTALNSSVKIINLCLEKNNLELSDLIYQPLASSIALLNTEELDVGICVIDIGSGTTNISIFADEELLFTTTIPVGGDIITDDIRKMLNTTRTEAERIKIEYGFASETEILQNEIIQIKGVGVAPHSEIDKVELCKIIQPRVTELFSFCKEEIDKSGYTDRLGAGYIITGGTANLKAICNLASNIFNAPVGVGYPSSDIFIGMSNEIEEPHYSSVAGLALHSLVHKSFVGETIKTLNKLEAKPKTDNSTQTKNKKVNEQDNDNINDEQNDTDKGLFEKIKEKVLNFMG
jgi:cell division protein FtsA